MPMPDDHRDGAAGSAPPGGKRGGQEGRLPPDAGWPRSPRPTRVPPGHGPGAVGEMLLEIRGLRVGYGRIEALREVSLEVAAGEIVTLIGANGAGKTTTLMSI